MKWFKKKTNIAFSNETKSKTNIFKGLVLKGNGKQVVNNQTNKSDNTQFLFESAFEKYLLKHDEEAIAILDELLEIDINNADAYSIRAACLNNLGYHLDAIDDYIKSLELKEDANNYGLCGFAYFSIGELETAYEYLNKAVTNGMNFYERYLGHIKSMLDSQLMSAMYKQSVIKENKLKRRSKIKKCYDLYSSPNELLVAYKNVLNNFKNEIQLNPENKELIETYNKCKMNFETIELYRYYLSSKDNPTKENMVRDLIKMGYNDNEAEEMTIMFFNYLNKGE